MLWIAVGFAIILAISSAFSDSGKKKNRTTQRQAFDAPKGRPSYASIEEGGEYHALTSEEVSAMLAPFRESLKVHKKAAAKAMDAAEIYRNSRSINPDALTRIQSEHAAAKETLSQIEALYDRMFFQRESSGDKFYKVVEDISFAEADLEDAAHDIEQTTEEIEQEDHNE